MVIRNEDVVRVVAEIPCGNNHLRTTVVLADGTEMVFQEATIASIVRAYIDVKTHPQSTRIELNGKRIVDRKEGYAEWQLIEEKNPTKDKECEAWTSKCKTYKGSAE